MKFLTALFGVILVIFMIGSGQLSAKQPFDPELIAKELVALVEAKKFEEARQRFNPELKKVLTAQALGQVQAQMEAAGAVKSIETSKMEARDGMEIASIRIERTAAAVVATVAIDEDGQVAGLHYGPAP